MRLITDFKIHTASEAVTSGSSDGNHTHTDRLPEDSNERRMIWQRRKEEGRGMKTEAGCRRQEEGR